MNIDPSLITAAAATAEALVNKTLMLDPAAQDNMSELDGAVIKLSLPPTDLSLTAQVCNRVLSISTNPDKFSDVEIDVAIEGSPLSVSRLIFEQDKNSLIRTGEIKLTGNAETAQKFQSVIAELELDWESALADIIGDIPAHFIGQKIRQGTSWGKQTRKSLTANIEEHLHEESQLLPNRIELQEHFSKIDHLRLSTERLEARLAKLSSIIDNK